MGKDGVRSSLVSVIGLNQCCTSKGRVGQMREETKICARKLVCPAPIGSVSGRWENRTMRMRIATGLVVMVMMGSFITPAHAIFGLSKCEKVKKEVNSLEKQYYEVRDGLGGKKYTYTFKGNSFTFFIPTEKSVKVIDNLIANDPLPKIWKLATNNPKCFTNTQNMQIPKMQSDSISKYLNHSTHPKYRNNETCKILLSEP